MKKRWKYILLMPFFVCGILVLLGSLACKTTTDSAHASSERTSLKPVTQPWLKPNPDQYPHKGVRSSHFAQRADGYWLFEPKDPMPDSANVIIFVHGFRALHAFVYGQWIRHLVQQGNIVIFPRYQLNGWDPMPRYYVENTVTGVKAALEQLQRPEHVKPRLDNVVYIGHSYGGTIVGNIAVNFKKLGMPPPAGVLLSAPGTGPFRGCRLESYAGIPRSTELVVVVHDGDRVTGDIIGRRIVETAVRTPNRILFRHTKDAHGSPSLKDGHYEACCVDSTLTAGRDDFKPHESLQKLHCNALDYELYWPMTDSLIKYARNPNPQTPFTSYMSPLATYGHWTDGKRYKPLGIWTSSSAEPGRN